MYRCGHTYDTEKVLFDGRVHQLEALIELDPKHRTTRLPSPPAVNLVRLPLPIGPTVGRALGERRRAVDVQEIISNQLPRALGSMQPSRVAGRTAPNIQLESSVI